MEMKKITKDKKQSELDFELDFRFFMFFMLLCMAMVSLSMGISDNSLPYLIIGILCIIAILLEYK